MSVFMLFGIFAPCVGASDLHEHLKKENFYIDESAPPNESTSRLYAFVSEHCDEIYAYAYAQAKSAGMIDELNVYLDKAVQAIRYAENQAFGCEAYFKSKEFALGLRAVADETVDTVEALRELLVNADSLDAESHEKATVLLEKLLDDLDQFASLIRIATEDAFVYADAVWKRKIAEVRAILNEKLNEIREAAAFAESVLKKQAETAEALAHDFIRLAEKYRKAFAGNREYTEKELRLLLKQFLGNAFSANYRISSDSFYLAIGEDVLYAEILAKRLGLSKEQFGVTGWNDTDPSLIAKADLITVGYSESMISGFAANQILCYIKNYADGAFREALGDYAEDALRHLFESMALTPNEAVFSEFRVQTGALLDAFLETETFVNAKSDTMDWAALIGEENAKYADSVRKTIKEALLQSGIPESADVQINVVQFLIENADQLDPSIANIFSVFEPGAIEALLGDYAFFTHELPVLDMLSVAAEAYLYGYVKFNIEYARLVYAIGAINPNALIVLLGNGRAFAGLDMDIVIDDMTIGLDMLPDYGIKASFDEAMRILTDVFDANAYQNTVNTVFDAMEARIAAVYDDIKTDRGYLREIDISEAALAMLVGEENAASAQKILCAVHYLLEEFAAYDRIEEEIPDVKTWIAELAASANQKTDAVLEEAFGTLGITVSEARRIFSALADGINDIHTQIAEVQSCINDIYEAIASIDITIKGASFDPGEILGAPMLAHSLFHACTDENVIFVDISDAQTVYGNASATDFLFAYIFDQSVCNISEAGHAYIAEQIHGALRIVCGHGDWDHDHLCNYCGKMLSVCANTNDDHLCDLCKAVMSECADTDGDHKCDICGAIISECADTDGDHKCNICGAVMSECADTDNDHKCNLCGVVMSECADPDNDHTCNLCGAVMSECADTDNDHKCNVCGKVLSECEDKNNDHACDICGELISACEDENNDHACDICGLVISVCDDADDNHVCDICGKVCSECADLDNDHLCDVCGNTLSECSYGEWVVTKEATKKEEGERYRECVICGQKDHNVIPKLGMSAVTVVAIVAVIVIALGGAVFAVYWFVYKKKNIIIETNEDEWIFS